MPNDHTGSYRHTLSARSYALLFLPFIRGIGINDLKRGLCGPKFAILFSESLEVTQPALCCNTWAIGMTGPRQVLSGAWPEIVGSLSSACGLQQEGFFGLPSNPNPSSAAARW